MTVCAIKEISATATVNLSGDPAKFRFVLDGGFVFRPGPGRFDPRGGTRAYTLMGVQEAATFEGSDGHGITLQWRSPSGQRVALNRGVMNIVFQKGSCPSG